MARIVVLLFGPSGAGKTTIARASNLTVFDRDDPQWKGKSEADFVRAIKALAHDPNARAVVIRAGATSSARARSITQTNATHAFLVDTSQADCHYRAGHRRRSDVKGSHAYIDSWFAKHERKDRINIWPGSWDKALTMSGVPHWLDPGRPCRAPRDRSKAGDPRSTRAWRMLRERVFREETHCWKCGAWVDQTLPPRHRMSRTADHLDPIGNGGAGIPDRSRVRLAHWTCNSKRGKGNGVTPITREPFSVSLDLV